MKRAFLLAIPLAVILGGCTAAEQRPTLMQPVAQPMAYQQPPQNYQNPGSIFEDGNAQYLFSDSRARRVGDIVMVNIMESSSASNTATTNTTRESTNEFRVESLFSKTAMPLFGGTVGATPIFGTSTNSDFQGEGTTTRRSAVTATVSARVLNVMPDGLLQIEGAREIKVNNETQYLVVSGLIRSRDISAGNSIMSTQIADVQIAYYGKGVISDKQKPGWFVRLMDTVWPF